MNNTGSQLAIAVAMVLNNDRKSHEAAVKVTREVMQRAAKWKPEGRHFHLLDEEIGDAIHTWLGETLPRYNGLPQDLIWAQLLGWVAWNELGRHYRTSVLPDLGAPEIPAGWGS